MFVCLAGWANAAALDLSGHGGTTSPYMNQGEDYATWMVGSLAAGSVRAFLLGHSLGGAIAITAGLTRPELPAGLMLWGNGACPRLVASYPERPGLGGRKLPWRPHSGLGGGAYVLDALCYFALKDLGRVALAQVDLRVTLGDYSTCDKFDVDVKDLPGRDQSAHSGDMRQERPFHAGEL
jgi:pimeloyl-ACP methyl ester carboxylesterase